MEQLMNFFNENINYTLLVIIILGGIFLTKYTKGVLIFNVNLKDSYKVLIASVIVSLIFYFIDDSPKVSQYFFTYLFATSFYELIVKWFLDKINKVFQE